MCAYEGRCGVREGSLMTHRTRRGWRHFLLDRVSVPVRAFRAVKEVLAMKRVLLCAVFLPLSLLCCAPDALGVLRIRKNYLALTAKEREHFRNAVVTLKNTPETGGLWRC